MQEQNSEKTVALSVKTGEMTAKVLKSAVKAFLNSQRNKKPLTDTEQSLFVAAHSYLKDVMNGKTTLPTKENEI